MDITEDNFLIFAIKSYNSPNCIMDEFESDLKRIKYIKRLIRKYRISGEMKERLLLNHIIVLANVFGVEASVRILFFKLSESDYPVLKPFLLFVNYLPRVVMGINGKNIITGDIHIDLDISRRLMDIYRKT